MYDRCIISTGNATNTRSAGASLAATLYGQQMTIALTGELGAGKTTFLQGFASALGIAENLTSPTYALEQRYDTPKGPFLHLDLYRLEQAHARALLAQSDDFAGIRCVEWFDRAHLPETQTGLIHLHFTEAKNSNARLISCTFQDAALPLLTDVQAWQKEVLLPQHIVDHSHAVAELCDRFAGFLMEHGRFVRAHALHAAGETHDLLRFIDFRPGGHPSTPSPEEQARWDMWTTKFPGMHHEQACAEFLRSQGYPVIADIVEPHGLHAPMAQRTTTEQKILFYADKRVMLDRVVTVDERFADFAQRYRGGTVTPDAQRWYEETRAVERDLFPDGAPF